MQVSVGHHADVTQAHRFCWYRGGPSDCDVKKGVYLLSMKPVDVISLRGFSSNSFWQVSTFMFNRGFSRRLALTIESNTGFLADSQEIGLICKILFGSSLKI
jgi:hypothetical protein